MPDSLPVLTAKGRGEGELNGSHSYSFKAFNVPQRDFFCVSNILDTVSNNFLSY